MIGPSARAHFIRALRLAEEAEFLLVPGAVADRATMRVGLAQIELIKAVAYAFLQNEEEGK